MSTAQTGTTMKAPNHDEIATMNLPCDVRLVGVYPDNEGRPVAYVILKDKWFQQVPMRDGTAGILAAISGLRKLDAQKAVGL